MYILNVARYEKKSRTLFPTNKGTVKLWVQPGTLFNKLDNAKDCLESEVNAVVEKFTRNGTYKQTHRRQNDESFLTVVEGSDCIAIFRITEDTPED